MTPTATLDQQLASALHPESSRADKVAGSFGLPSGEPLVVLQDPDLVTLSVLDALVIANVQLGLKTHTAF